MKDAFGVQKNMTMPKYFIVKKPAIKTPGTTPPTTPAKNPADRAKELWQAKQDARTPQARNAWKAGRHIND